MSPSRVRCKCQDWTEERRKSLWMYCHFKAYGCGWLCSTWWHGCPGVGGLTFLLLFSFNELSLSFEVTCFYFKKKKRKKNRHVLVWHEIWSCSRSTFGGRRGSTSRRRVGGWVRSHRRGLQVITLLCCRFSLGWTRAVLIVSHSGAEQASFFFVLFSGPVLQNDSQPFEKKKSFSKDCQDFEKKKKKKI